MFVLDLSRVFIVGKLVLSRIILARFPWWSEWILTLRFVSSLSKRWSGLCGLHRTSFWLSAIPARFSCLELLCLFHYGSLLSIFAHRSRGLFNPGQIFLCAAREQKRLWIWICTT
jgi:hypothetical protein